MAKGGIADNEKELVDVVDENDIVISQKTKKEVHAGDGILHREIGVIIFDSNKNILMQQRSLKKRLFPGEWTISVIGHVPAGKTPEEAAHIELMEELGFDTQVKFVEKRKFETGTHVTFGYIFLGLSPKGVHIIPDKDEIEKVEYFTIAKLQSMMREKIIGYHSIETLNRYFSGVYGEP